MKPILPSRVQPCPLARTTPPYPFSLRRPGVLDVGVPRGVVGATAHASVCELLPFFVRGMDDFEYKAVCVCVYVCVYRWEPCWTLCPTTATDGCPDP